MIIDFKIVPHKKQRYDTVGDYFLKRGRWFFRISKMKDPRYPIIVLLHEVIEFFLVRTEDIAMKEIDHFDQRYEDAREKMERHGFERKTPCGCEFYEDPGDDPHAPYHRQHQVATQCERLICEALGVKWEQYCEVVESL
jgi:hypothetical protein